MTARPFGSPNWKQMRKGKNWLENNVKKTNISSYFKDDSILSALALLRSYAHFTRIRQGRIKYSLYIEELWVQTTIV